VVIVRVRAIGGLANRLRVALSYRGTYPRVEVVWVADGEIAGAHFRDVFRDTIDGLTFVDEPRGDEVVTTDPLPHARSGWWELYRDLRLHDPWSRLYDELRAALPKPFAAMHIRRTDMPGAGGEGESDADFVRWANEQPGHVYLATDNGTTQKTMLARCERPERIVLAGKILEHADQDASNRRNTSLGWAAVDLFTCARSSAFKGCNASSFSHLVMRLRAMGGWWSE
jgi:hypothetical protein